MSLSIMLIIQILGFTAIVGFVSYYVSKKHERMERAEIATYITLIAWGALIFGMYLARCHKQILF